MARQGRIAVVACGALSTDIATLVTRHGWPLDVHPLPPLLHNHPERIAGQVAELADRLARDYEQVAVGYADCGSYGAIDEVCRARGLTRLGGNHCYDVYAGQRRLAAELEAEPGTYLLTDFLAVSFERTVVAELGLDRHPELREDYFAHYTRVVWLAGRRAPQIEDAARAAAARIGLPLEVLDVGLGGLESELAALLGQVQPAPR
jgi:Protein of unknown function (DUF1638)